MARKEWPFVRLPGMSKDWAVGFVRQGTVTHSNQIEMALQLLSLRLRFKTVRLLLRY
jgi:hypothetical protein